MENVAERQTTIASIVAQQGGMQMDNIHSQMGYRDPQTASYREKCQRPAAGSCPAFPTLASQNPTQIFPGSDTSLALRSLLKAERNKKRITPTVFK